MPGFGDVMQWKSVLAIQWAERVPLNVCRQGVAETRYESHSVVRRVLMDQSGAFGIVCGSGPQVPGVRFQVHEGHDQEDTRQQPAGSAPGVGQEE